MKTIELRPISNKFTEEVNGSVCISPRFWGWGLMQGREAKELLIKAKEMAKDVDDICFAVVYDDILNIEYVLGEHTGNMFTKFILFNAKEEVNNKKIGTKTVFMKKELPGGMDFAIIEKYVSFRSNSIY